MGIGQKRTSMTSSVALGVARVVLHLPDSGSLKAKRHVISGLLRRLRQELKVSAAEVGGQVKSKRPLSRLHQARSVTGSIACKNKMFPPKKRRHVLVKK